MLNLYVDGDACPVKQEIVRVATRHGLEVFMVSNSGLRTTGPNIHSIMVGREFDAADNWITEQTQTHDIVITSDILLAARCLEKGAEVISPSGKPFTRNNIGSAIAMRELSSQLRQMGEINGYNPSFTKQDRSRFLQQLEESIQKLKRLPKPPA